MTSVTGCGFQSWMLARLAFGVGGCGDGQQGLGGEKGKGGGGGGGGSGVGMGEPGGGGSFFFCFPNLCARPSLTRSNRRGTDPYARWREPSRLGGQIALGLLADDGVEGRFGEGAEWRENKTERHNRKHTPARRRRRRAIQLSEEKNIALAKRYGVSRKTIAKWKAREFTSDARMGPTNPRASILTQDDEATS